MPANNRYKIFFSGRITILILIPLLLIVSIISCRIPFFWNMVRYSQIAQYYISTNFSSLYIPQELDNGNPPFYGLYFALIWKLFGKSLLVSHLAFYPFVIGLFIQFYFLCKKFLPEKLIPLALILLLIEPTILTQSLLMGYDIVLMFLFLLGLNIFILGGSF